MIRGCSRWYSMIQMVNLMDRLRVNCLFESLVALLYICRNILVFAPDNITMLVFI